MSGRQPARNTDRYVGGELRVIGGAPPLVTLLLFQSPPPRKTFSASELTWHDNESSRVHLTFHIRSNYIYCFVTFDFVRNDERTEHK